MSVQPALVKQITAVLEPLLVGFDPADVSVALHIVAMRWQAHHFGIEHARRSLLTRYRFFDPTELAEP